MTWISCLSSWGKGKGVPKVPNCFKVVKEGGIAAAAARSGLSKEVSCYRQLMYKYKRAYV